MINVPELSKKYEVRKMEDSDAESILNLCPGKQAYGKEEKLHAKYDVSDFNTTSTCFRIHTSGDKCRSAS